MEIIIALGFILVVVFGVYRSHKRNIDLAKTDWDWWHEMNNL